MIQKEYKFLGKLGMHARPAALISKAMKQFTESDITIKLAESKIDAKKTISLLGLDLKNGDNLILITQGGDENLVINLLIKILDDCVKVDNS